MISNRQKAILFAGAIVCVVAAVARGIPVHRVKVYNIAGLTVFSSNLGQIGESRANHPNFRVAVDEKRPASGTSFRYTFTGFEGARSAVHLVETYIPIMGPQGAIEGVFEIYSEANAAFARIRES
jgi:hypothetical protein